MRGVSCTNCVVMCTASEVLRVVCAEMLFWEHIMCSGCAVLCVGCRVLRFCCEEVCSDCVVVCISCRLLCVVCGLWHLVWGVCVCV